MLPEHFKEKFSDGLVDLLKRSARALGKDPEQFNALKSDSKFLKDLREAFDLGFRDFFNEIEISNPKLAMILREKKEDLYSEEFIDAVLSVSKSPGSKPNLETQNKILLPMQQASEVENEELVEIAGLLVNSVANRVRLLPELAPVFQTYFAQKSAEGVAKLVSHSEKTAGIMEQIAISQQSSLPPPKQEKLKSDGIASKVSNNVPQFVGELFVGRAEEEEKVLSVLRPYPESQFHIAVLDGLGGVGKTTLALRVAQKVLFTKDAGLIFDAVIWVSAKESILTAQGILPRTQASRSLRDIIQTIASVLDLSFVRHPQHSWEAVYDEVMRELSKKRTLIILDNFETITDDSVLSFAREVPAPTKIIITSRRKIEIAYPIRLAGLEKQEALELGELIRSNSSSVISDDELALILEGCAGIPLAIEWSLALIDAGHSVNAVVEKLNEDTNDLSQFMFEEIHSIVSQNDVAYCTLISLALFPGGAKESAVATISNFDGIELEEAVVLLKSLRIVNQQGARLSILPITRNYLLNQLKKYQHRNFILKNWQNYFENYVSAYLANRSGWQSQQDLITEGDNLLALFNWAIDNSQYELAYSLLSGVVNYLDLSGKWLEVVTYGQEVMAAAKDQNRKDIVSWMGIHWFGWIFVDQGRLEEATKLAMSSVRYYDETGNHSEHFVALNHLGRVYRRAGDFENAINVYTTAKNLASEHLRKSDELKAILQLAKLNRDMNDWPKANEKFRDVKHYLESLQSSGPDQVMTLMEAVGGLGWSEFHLGNTEQGLNYLEEALEYMKSIGGKGYCVSLHYRVAVIYLKLEDYKTSRMHAKKSLEGAMQLGITREIDCAAKLIEILDSREQTDAGS